MAKGSAMAREMTGATWVGKGEGRGNTLKFVNIPDSMSGALLEELSGLGHAHPHPLKGAVFHTENHANKTFDIVVSQNDCEVYIAKVFADWFMGWTFMEYADDDTKFKVETAKEVPA